MEDISVGVYLKTVLDLIFIRVKSLPPAQRKVLSLKMVLDSLEKAPADLKSIEKDYMQAKSH